jgi:hypothetical protein
MGAPPAPEQVQRTGRLRAILAEGWKITPAEAARLETDLAHNPQNLPLRVRLISYYFQYMLNEPRARHVLWLIENHPDADAFEDALMITGFTSRRPDDNQASDYVRARALWQEQARRFPNNTTVLSNAAVALSNEDAEIALQLIQAARRAEPGNPAWTRWLAKSYADAIRWSFWDGSTPMVFTGDTDDYRHNPIRLPPPMRGRARTELESSTDPTLVAAVGEALLREVRLLRERSATSQEPFSPITPELPQVAEFGQNLVARARTLEPKR